MADAKKTEEAAAEPAPAKSKKGLMIAVIAIVLVVVIGGAAAFFLMKGKPPADEGDEEGDEPTTKVEKSKKAKKGEAEAPPVFVKLEPFTVKLQTEQQEAYLQATPELRVLDAHIGDKVKQYTPEIRHKVQLILIGKKASEISAPQGVQALANEMRVTINGILEPPAPRKKGAREPEPPGDRAGPDEPVQAVLFTQFIIQ
jgi:flagellar FliL protein